MNTLTYRNISDPTRPIKMESWFSKKVKVVYYTALCVKNCFVFTVDD